MDRMEDEYTISASTKGDIRTFDLEEINWSAGNEFQTKLFPFF